MTLRLIQSPLDALSVTENEFSLLSRSLLVVGVLGMRSEGRVELELPSEDSEPPPDDAGMVELLVTVVLEKETASLPAES